MSKKGTGIGSASIVLVFSVLCLTIFAIISYSSALTDRALVDVEARLVSRYYEADKLANLIFAELLQADDIPETLYGVEITTEWDFWGFSVESISFTLEISDKREMYVVLGVHYDTMDILTWRMRDIGGAWESDDVLNIFDGDFSSLWGN
jgi:hypothetical protein